MQEPYKLKHGMSTIKIALALMLLFFAAPSWAGEPGQDDAKTYFGRGQSELVAGQLNEAIADFTKAAKRGRECYLAGATDALR